MPSTGPKPCRILRGWLLVAALSAAMAGSLRAAGSTSAPLQDLARQLVQRNENLWRNCETPTPELSSRSLFAYALALCEAGEHPERLEPLLDRASQMQDRDPASRGCGNFRWYWRDAKVLDYNAVDFCMRGGSLLWLKHGRTLPAGAREKLRQILPLAIQGCLRHKVPESYSNIALMNAGDLILLGEGLEDAAAAAEGYARLDRCFRYTQQAGVHEFVSPTYTGVDLDGLAVIEAYCREARGRAQARALLELFWTDIAANWFPPAQRLAGAHSRTYDFLRGLGYLDVALAWNGWIAGPPPRELDAIYGAQAHWRPGENLRDLSRKFPRLVRQSWGEQPWQSRTHYLLNDVTLSCAASSYGGRMDMPLTVDLPGDRNSIRGYFIADGRQDPYGKKKIPAGPHEKAFHLDPLWAGVQQDGDALGLVVYRSKDIPTNAVGLSSDFVLPFSADGFSIGGKPVLWAKAQASRVPVPPGAVVTLRRGKAALALRVIWSRDCANRSAPAELVYDGNEFGAIRLSVQHAKPGDPVVVKEPPPGAAFHARIGTGFPDDAAVARWAETLAKVPAKTQISGTQIQVEIPAAAKPLRLGAAAPWTRPENLEPPPSRAVLELNGEDIGSRILEGAVKPE